MMLDRLYRLIHFRQRRIVLLRLNSLIFSEAGRLIKHQPDADGRSSILTVGAIANEFRLKPIPFSEVDNTQPSKQ